MSAESPEKATYRDCLSSCSEIIEIIVRKKIVAGNWKMNTVIPEGGDLALNILENYTETEGVEVILAPPFTHLQTLAVLVTSTNLSYIYTAAQDCSAHLSGAYTGEVSAEMIASTGASHIIIGHSERRLYHNEKEPLLKEKISRTLAAGLKPVYCVGETLEQRESGDYREVIRTQLTEATWDFPAEHIRRMIIAYEPVWAIGTGKTATPEQAQEIHAFIRQMFAEQFDNETAQQIPILYGGSVKPSNAVELFSMPDIDGALVGGASLVAADFLDIIQAAVNTTSYGKVS